MLNETLCWVGGCGNSGCDGEDHLVEHGGDGFQFSVPSS